MGGGADAGRWLGRWLHAAGLKPAADAEEGLRALVDWSLVRSGRTTPAAGAALMAQWRRRLAREHEAGGREYPGSRELAETRERNLHALALGAGGVTHLARQVGRGRHYYQRVLAGERALGVRSARALEAGLGLPLGWLDDASRPLREAVEAGARVAARTKGE